MGVGVSDGTLCATSATESSGRDSTTTSEDDSAVIATTGSGATTTGGGSGALMISIFCSTGAALVGLFFIALGDFTDRSWFSGAESEAPWMLISAPLGDSNFKWQSVDNIVKAALPVFKLHGAAENLRVH